MLAGHHFCQHNKSSDVVMLSIEKESTRTHSSLNKGDVYDLRMVMHIQCIQKGPYLGMRALIRTLCSKRYSLGPFLVQKVLIFNLPT